MQDPRYPTYAPMSPVPGAAHSRAVADSITVAPASHQPMDPPSAALIRLMRRRVPPEKRQRTEMSCDWCKKKRCKCLRGSTVDTCRACSEIGRPCTTTEPRKRRVYGSLSTASVLAASAAPKQHQHQQQHQQKHRTSSASSTTPDSFAASTVSSIGQPLSPFSLGNGIDPIDDMSLDPLVLDSLNSSTTGFSLTVSPRDTVTCFRDDATDTASTAPPSLASAAAALVGEKDGTHTANEHLFEDALGLPRYIGPLGSYSLLAKLWDVMAAWRAPGMAPPAAHCASARPRFGSTSTISDSTIIDGADHTIQQRARGRSIDLPARDVADVLVALFFDNVHCDFPVFHRALFQASYEHTWTAPSASPSQSPHRSGGRSAAPQPQSSYRTDGPEAEPAWRMCLSMVFVLGLEAASAQSSAIRRLVGNAARRDALKARCLAQVHEVLPEVIAGSMLVHVQALMLYCRYLHITRNRNACWNLTGAAIRGAVAIGLHRNGVHGKCSPLERELRRRVWWTLYAFERIECSSLGRTSAIDDSECNAGEPAEGLLDMADTMPAGYVGAHAGLMRLLGSICKQQYGGSRGDDDGALDADERDAASLPVPQEHADFARATAKALDLWRAQLPAHLSLCVDVDADPPRSHQRAVLLLHVQHHYTVTLLCRPFLLALVAKNKPAPALDENTTRPRPTQAEAGADESATATLLLYARKCIEAAKSAVAVIERLFRAGLLNSKTWWDVYFIEASCMVLAMGRFVDDYDLRNDVGIIDALRTCIEILRECKEFSPTMQRIALVTTDFAQTLVSDNACARGDKQARQTPQHAQPQHAPLQHHKYPQQHPTPILSQGQQGQYGFELQLQGLPGQQQHSPLVYCGSHDASANTVPLLQDVDDFSGEMTSRSESSQSGSSPDDSFLPVVPGSIFANPHDPAGVSMTSSSVATHDPFPMPWNMGGISQFWGDWAEPDHWWQP